MSSPPVRELWLAPLRRFLGTRADWRLVRPAVPPLPRPGLHWLGPLLVMVTIAAGWPAFAGATGEDGGLQLAMFVGAASIVAMAWTFVLAVRIPLLEPWFGGLDRMYRVHRWLAAFAVGAMFLHTQTIDEPRGGVAGAGRGLAGVAEELAGVAELLLYALVLVSVVRLVPTRYWRWTHKFLGVPYAFACFHFATAEKTFAVTSAWGWWFNVWMIIGTVAWLVRVVGRDMVRTGVSYRVRAVERGDAALHVVLEPTAQPLRFRAGQFAFVKVHAPGLPEPHPFTIASAPSEPVLRFYIRELGDWTAHLPEQLVAGTEVTVEGPYGRFRPFPRRPEEGVVVWVAGGVGITPFLAAIAELRAGASPPPGDPPHLVYSVRSRHEAVALAELEQAHAAGLIRLHLHESSVLGRVSAATVLGYVGSVRMRGAHLAVCGPAPLVAAITAAGHQWGARRVEHEQFDIRSGVGPDRSREIEAAVAAGVQRVAHLRSERRASAE